MSQILKGVVTNGGFAIFTDRQHEILDSTEIELKCIDPLVGGWEAKTKEHTFGLSSDRIRRYIKLD